MRIRKRKGGLEDEVCVRVCVCACVCLRLRLRLCACVRGGGLKWGLEREARGGGLRRATLEEKV